MEIAEFLKIMASAGGGALLTYLLVRGQLIPKATHDSIVLDLKDQLTRERINSQKWEERALIATDQSKKLVELTTTLVTSTEKS